MLLGHRVFAVASEIQYIERDERGEIQNVVQATSNTGEIDRERRKLDGASCGKTNERRDWARD